MAGNGSAPVYTVPAREVVAVEHPMAIKNIDNGLKTFGRKPAFDQIINADDYEACLPLYLRSRDPSCPPNLSHNAATSNVLLKITLPKRTGRKRKRGSQGPFEYHPEDAAVEHTLPPPQAGQTPGLLSHSRLDAPGDLQRRLRDCREDYEIEPIGNIEQTHRYRGLSDFHYSTSHGSYMTKFRETIMTGDLEKLKEYKLDPSRGPKPLTELIPPPIMTDHPLPFNWGYHQNPTIKVTMDPETGAKTLVNNSTPAKLGTLYIAHDIASTPTGPPNSPPDDPILLSLIQELQSALAERPIWTRRAILNRLSASPGIYLLKPAIQYVGYQFRGGPWRDAIIRYGVDPRTDPKYRFYQTLFFKIHAETEKAPGQPWTDVRSEYTRRAQLTNVDLNSHIFDGTHLTLDGKVWQVCDITDPLIQRLAATPTLQSECDLETSGWYCNGTWAKIKAVMRTKITAIRAGKQVPDSAFDSLLRSPDHVEDKASSKVTVPLPDLKKLGIKVDDLGAEGSRKKRLRLAARKWKGGKKNVPGLGDAPETEAPDSALPSVSAAGGGGDETAATVELPGMEQDDDEMAGEDEDEEEHDEDEDEVIDYDEGEEYFNGLGEGGEDEETATAEQSRSAFRE